MTGVLIRRREEKRQAAKHTEGLCMVVYDKDSDWSYAATRMAGAVRT